MTIIYCLKINSWFRNGIGENIYRFYTKMKIHIFIIFTNDAYTSLRSPYPIRSTWKKKMEKNINKSDNLHFHENSLGSAAD